MLKENAVKENIKKENVVKENVKKNAVKENIIKENIVKEYMLGNATVYLIFLQELSEADFQEMYALCSRERREKINKITSVTKQRQSISAGYLIYILKKKFGIEEEVVVLPEGKPVFRGNGDVNFNISHSGGYVVLAFGNAPLGVDIECVKQANLKLAKRFFTKEEYTYLLEQKEDEQKDAFCRIWTGKEAVVKAEGSGLLQPLDSFSVLGNEVELLGKKYELCQRRLPIEGQGVWVSVACVNRDGRIEKD